ncbi:MAG: J domain-containing protein [Hormoscilla sp. GM102CHS1]|nr:J domain-containing protein [Hormoscilla sp. GM102CHS1]
MDIAECYRLLGLRPGASLAEIKSSYRRLARQYHPDVNSTDKLASQKFIQLTEAYKFLLLYRQILKAPQGSERKQEPPKTKVKVKTKSSKNEKDQYVKPLSEADQKLKDSSYKQLQELLIAQIFPRAIALVEALAGRFPHDRSADGPKNREVRQWQAIVYQRWGSHLIDEKQVNKARAYLKKALKTDPHNRSL